METINGKVYYNRADMLAKGWTITDVQKFPHDKTKRSETGRGRPSYLYLETRVNDFKATGKCQPSELEVASAVETINRAASQSAFKPKLFMVERPDPIPAICTKPQAISEPVPAPKPVMMASPTFGASYGPKPEGVYQCIVVDALGNETALTV